MRKGISILLLFCGLSAFTQQNFPPEYEINTDTITNQELPDAYVHVLPDKTGKLTIQQVSTPPLAKQFIPSANGYDYFSARTHWQQFRIQNHMAGEAKIGLYEHYGFLSDNERVDYYIKYGNGQWEHNASGWSTPWSKLDGLKRIGFFPLVLKEGEEVIVFRRIYNSGHYPFSNFSVSIGSTYRVIQERYVKDEVPYFTAINNAIIFSFCLFAALFSLIFFFMVRERAYLYFGLYVLFIGVGRFVEEVYNLFLREHPSVLIYVYYYGVFAFVSFFLIQFIRHFLKTFGIVPRLDKYLNVSNIVSVITAFFSLFFTPTSQVVEKAYGSIRSISLSIAIILTLVTFFVVLQKQKWSNKILSFAIFPAFLVWGVLMTYTQLFYFIPVYILEMPPNNLTRWRDKWWLTIETLCLGIQVVAFSWLLLQRFGEQRKQIAQLALEKERERSQLIEQQKEDLEKQVAERTSELKHSLQELKATQAQLIQSEKMASLGELTAGIAHEIQNPLNFVKNFSETNSELISELKGKAQAGNLDDVLQLAEDIEDNEQKIVHHGKRADAIVKSMMEHSRASGGDKQPTDINTLVEEYVRLAYHGFKAKDKTFEATIETAFDENAGKVNIVPQDIGRVLLNLINNAFYAVAEKKKQQPEGYEQSVSISTEKLNDKINIVVNDNGMGISKSVQDKIFQPFFTTKPTGEGTGLGLSLGYDIIKALGGEIRVETKEGEGSAFIIELPGK